MQRVCGLYIHLRMDALDLHSASLGSELDLREISI